MGLNRARGRRRAGDTARFCAPHMAGKRTVRPLAAAAPAQAAPQGATESQGRVPSSGAAFCTPASPAEAATEAPAAGRGRKRAYLPHGGVAPAPGSRRAAPDGRGVWRVRARRKDEKERHADVPQAPALGDVHLSLEPTYGPMVEARMAQLLAAGRDGAAAAAASATLLAPFSVVSRLGGEKDEQVRRATARAFSACEAVARAQAAPRGGSSRLTPAQHAQVYHRTVRLIASQRANEKAVPRGGKATHEGARAHAAATAEVATLLALATGDLDKAADQVERERHVAHKDVGAAALAATMRCVEVMLELTKTRRLRSAGGVSADRRAAAVRGHGRSSDDGVPDFDAAVDLRPFAPLWALALSKERLPKEANDMIDTARGKVAAVRAAAVKAEPPRQDVLLVPAVQMALLSGDMAEARALVAGALKAHPHDAAVASVALALEEDLAPDEAGAQCKAALRLLRLDPASEAAAARLEALVGDTSMAVAEANEKVFAAVANALDVVSGSRALWKALQAAYLRGENKREGPPKGHWGGRGRLWEARHFGRPPSDTEIATPGGADRAIYKMFIAKRMFPRSQKAKAYAEAVPQLIAQASGAAASG